MAFSFINSKDGEIDPNKFRIDRLKETDDISCLDCTDEDGNDEQGLQKFLCEFSINHQKNNISVTHLVYYDELLIGYFAVAMSLIPVNLLNEQSPEGISSDITRYPSLIIANFAIDKNYRNKGFGSLVLKHCIGMAKFLSHRVGCRYVTLYAREALTFYSKDNKTPYKFYISKKQEKNDFKLMYYPIY